MAAPQASSRLEMLQARFQQKQLQEKEQKLLQLYDQQQQRAYQVVQRGSAGSSSSHHGSTAGRAATTTSTTTTSHTTSTSQGGKVRQMFDERRQTTVKGIDRSYPLEPLENRLRKQANTNGVATQRNGNVTVNRQSVKRVARADINSNVNGGKPVVSYHEEIVRDSFGPSVRRHDDEDEYGYENRVAAFANGHYRHEIDNEQEEALDQDMMERNRMMAKIHLMGFDETLKHRVRNDLDSEEFPEYLMTDIPDKHSKRNVTKKLSQAEERLERFKNANAKRSNMPKQSSSTVIRKRTEQAIPAKSNSRLRSAIAGTSPTSTRSGSSRTSGRSQRNLEKSPLPTRSRVANVMSTRRRESSDTEIRTSPRSFSTGEATRAEATSRFYPRNNAFKSLTSDGKIFVRRSASPQFLRRESERSGTTMSIDRKSDSSGSPLFHWETKRNRSTPFFLNESERSRRTCGSRSPVWGDVGISSRRSTSPQYFHYEPKRSATATSTDRETLESKSPFYEEKRRSTSPQFFCRESERSATTMSIDRATSESRSPSHDREVAKRTASPRFFLSESEQSRRTSGSKSPTWGDREMSSRRSTSPRYYESKRSETATSTDRETIESKSSERSARPRFFCVESERSGTTMSIDRKVSEPRSYDRKILTKRSATPPWNIEQRSAATTSIDRKYNGFKSSGVTRDKRSTSPQFFCKESEKSATTMLIEPRPDSSKGILKQRNYVTDTSYGRRSVKSPIDKKISSTKYRGTPSPSFTRHEVRKAPNKNGVFDDITKGRRSSKISETSATSASSIVNLKYGLEFDDIFQSAGLVRKFMKSQDGKRANRQSPSRRNVTDARISARSNQSKNRRKTPPLLQTMRSPSVERRRRATPEFSRKTITPTEVDMDIQEITMTDHRIERDKLQKASSPIPKRQFDGTYAKSSGSREKFKTSIAYPVHKTPGQRESILESSFFKRDLTETRPDRRSDRESEKSVVSFKKFSPVSESPCVITRDRNGNDNKTSSPTRKQSARNRDKYIATRSTKHDDRQRASSRSPNRMRDRSAENRVGSPKTTSPDFSRVKKYSGTVSPILYDIAKKSKRACTKFNQPQSLRSTRLVQGAAKGRHLSTGDEYRGIGGDENKNATVDEVDAGIGVKYQTVVETALNDEIKDHRKIIRSNSADRIINQKVFLRETTQKPTMKSSTSKKTISPTGDCDRRHDIKSRISPRVSPLRKTTEISRDNPKTFLSRSTVPKADQSPTSKFSTYTAKDRKHESILVAKKLAESFREMSVKRKAEKPKDSVKEFSKMLREDKYKKDLERMDSVESALKRFDSIGAEFERSSPTDLWASPEISLQTTDVQTKASIKGSIDLEGTIVPPRAVTDHTILRSMLKSPVGKDMKAKNAMHKSDLRILRKETHPFKKPTREDYVESKQRSTKIRSSTCKRRLFESDSEKEIQEERSKSSYVKARKVEDSPFVNFKFRKDEAVPNVRSSKDRDVTRESMKSEEMPAVFVKPLRSIEDIRKSIGNKRNKLVATEESRSAIATRRSASREGVDAKRSSSATNAARNVFRGADPARLIKIKSCVSRTTKSLSPDSVATKQREMNVQATRGSAPSSPSKSPEVAPRRTATELRNQEGKPSRRSMVAKSANSTESKAMATGTADTINGVVLGSPNESTIRKSDAFVIDFDDRSSRENDVMPLKKSSMKKSPNDKQQTASDASGRPTSSNSSVNLTQDSSAKGRMAEIERGKGIGKGGGKSKSKGTTEKLSSGNGKLASFNEDATDMKGLVKCKTCGRSFAQNRIDLHEEICMKTAVKKRKQFDPVMNRVKGTELESFVKKNLSKRETKTKKPEAKPDWRRKHEEFINTIRYARETQARLAAGGNLNDLPPPPPSDTSDYVQCEHCGRKFNRSAAERHIPICKRMHDKKQTQAPKARR